MKTTEPLRRIKRLSEHCRKKAVGWQRGDKWKLYQRAKYRAFKQAAQIVAEFCPMRKVGAIKFDGKIRRIHLR